MQVCSETTHKTHPADFELDHVGMFRSQHACLVNFFSDFSMGTSIFLGGSCL